MKQKIISILMERGIKSGYDIDLLYEAGMKSIIDNIEYYYDKPYTCESVLKELFIDGIERELV